MTATFEIWSAPWNYSVLEEDIVTICGFCNEFLESSVERIFAVGRGTWNALFAALLMWFSGRFTSIGLARNYCDVQCKLLWLCSLRTPTRWTIEANTHAWQPQINRNLSVPSYKPLILKSTAAPSRSEAKIRDSDCAMDIGHRSRSPEHTSWDPERGLCWRC